jgi:hypothetical protein
MLRRAQHDSLFLASLPPPLGSSRVAIILALVANERKKVSDFKKAKTPGQHAQAFFASYLNQYYGFVLLIAEIPASIY